MPLVLLAVLIPDGDGYRLQAVDGDGRHLTARYARTDRTIMVIVPYTEGMTQSRPARGAGDCNIHACGDWRVTSL